MGHAWMSVTGADAMRQNPEEDTKWLAAGKLGYKAFHNPEMLQNQANLHLQVNNLMLDCNEYISSVKYDEELVTFTFSYINKDNTPVVNADKAMVYREMLTGLMSNPNCIIDSLEHNYAETNSNTVVVFKKMRTGDSDYDYNGMSKVKMDTKAGNMTVGD